MAESGTRPRWSPTAGDSGWYLGPSERPSSSCLRWLGGGPARPQSLTITEAGQEAGLEGRPPPTSQGIGGVIPGGSGNLGQRGHPGCRVMFGKVSLSDEKGAGGTPTVCRAQ